MEYTGFATKKERLEYLLSRDGDLCFICQLPFDKDAATIDHWIPLSKGGTWDIDNLRLTHRQCNNWKADQVPDKNGKVVRQVKDRRKVVKRSNGRRGSLHPVPH